MGGRDAVVEIMFVVWISHLSSRSMFYLLYFAEDRTVSVVKQCQIVEGCRVEPGSICHVKIKRKCYEGIVVTYGEYMPLLSGRSIIEDTCIFH